MTKTTQNEPIANPSSLSSHKKLNSVVWLLCTPIYARSCVHVRVSYPFNIRVGNFLEKRESDLMFCTKTQKEARRKSDSYIHLFI